MVNAEYPLSQKFYCFCSFIIWMTWRKNLPFWIEIFWPIIVWHVLHRVAIGPIKELFLHRVAIGPIKELFLHRVAIGPIKELFLHRVAIGPIKELFINWLTYLRWNLVKVVVTSRMVIKSLLISTFIALDVRLNLKWKKMIY